LNLLEADVHLLTEELHRQRDERHRDEEQQRQSHADAKHQREDDHDDEDRLERVHDHRSGELSHGGEIVGGARHQIADAIGLKEGERQTLDVRVEVASQIVFDVARHVDENATLEEEKNSANEAHAEDRQRGAHERACCDVRA
jgi:hypothetical protein